MGKALLDCLYCVDGADNIPSESVTADLVKRQTDSGTVDVVQITWKDPAGPNGVIVRVDVEYLSAERPVRSEI